MPRKSFSGEVPWGSLGSLDAMRTLIAPQRVFDKCESSAFVREAILHASVKDLAEVSPYIQLLPDAERLRLCADLGRSEHKLEPLQTEEDRNKAAANAATNLSSARTWFEHAVVASDAVRPTMYYYGALSFLKFIASCLVKTRSARGAHGLSVSCNSDGSDFDRTWPRDKCRVEIEKTGDFPFLVDVFAAAGWPSLFSNFRLHQDAKNAPWMIKENPAPIAKEKMSLDLLCNFDFDKYLSDHPELNDWLVGASKSQVAHMTNMLLDFVTVFVASSLGRYYLPAWTAVVRADKSPIFNDIRAAYRSVSMDAPLFFSNENPFKYSFCATI